MGTLQDGIEKWATENDMPTRSTKTVQVNTGGAHAGNRRQFSPEQAKGAAIRELPVDYVDEAERVIMAIYQKQGDIKGRQENNKITTSKIRKILSQIMEVYNAERIRNDDKLLPESMRKIQLLRVRILYEAGRDKKTVEPFVRKSWLLEYIKGIGDSRRKFIDFTHYMEALVAYHRYYGGKD